jgi:hypothetical protein
MKVSMDLAQRSPVKINGDGIVSPGASPPTRLRVRQPAPLHKTRLARTMARQMHFAPTSRLVAYRFLRWVFSRSTLLSMLLLALTAANGKSIKMVTSWFNPRYKDQIFHKILVIGVAQNLKVRADFEDEMATQIARPGIQTIPGNQILLRPDPKAKPDLDYLRAQIRDNGIDAMVVSRLLKIDKRVISIPSSTYIAPFPYYYSFYGYLGAVYPVVYDPGYTREDTTVSVETNVYATSKPDGDLVWTGVSNSFNPKSAEKVADGLVKVVPKQMEKDGLLAKKPASN